jgi:ketosteroid isomerase-like protein
MPKRTDIRPGATSSEEILRGATDALNRGDLDDFVTWMHPEVEFRSLIAEAEGETFRGHEGVRAWWGSVRAAFADARWDYQEVKIWGERGIAKVRITGALSGVQLEQTMWQAFAQRDGKAVWWEFFRTEQEAVEAVRSNPP